MFSLDDFNKQGILGIQFYNLSLLPLFRCKRQMQTQGYLDRCHILLLPSVTRGMQMIMPSVSFVSAVPWVLWIVLEASREMNSTQLLWELQMGVQDLTRGNYKEYLCVLDNEVNRKYYRCFPKCHNVQCKYACAIEPFNLEQINFCTDLLRQWLWLTLLGQLLTKVHPLQPGHITS